MKKTIKWIICIYFFIVILFILLDYYNFFDFITIHLNIEFFGIFINAITTIVLFLLSYILINKKINDNENDRKYNKEMALYVMLNETYSSCNESVEFFCNENTLKKYIVPKVDFNSTNDSFLEFHINRVFKYDIKILEMVSDGVVNKSTLKQYIDIKNKFHDFINLKVALFDINSSKYKGNVKATTARKNLNSLEENLKKNLNVAIKSINKYLEN